MPPVAQARRRRSRRRRPASQRSCPSDVLAHARRARGGRHGCSAGRRARPRVPGGAAAAAAAAVVAYEAAAAAAPAPLARSPPMCLWRACVSPATHTLRGVRCAPCEADAAGGGRDDGAAAAAAAAAAADGLAGRGRSLCVVCRLKAFLDAADAEPPPPPRRASVASGARSSSSQGRARGRRGRPLLPKRVGRRAPASAARGGGARGGCGRRSRAQRHGVRWCGSVAA